MQCDNCGYIFFQPSKKCACCSAPYVPAPSAFDVGQENLFTIFEMAPGEGGIPSSMGMAGAGAGVEDYNFTDDFDTGETGYGADDNVLDLSDAEAEGFGPAIAAAGPMSVDDFDFDTSGMDGTPSIDNAGPDNFDLNLPDDSAGDEMVATETPELEAEADDAANMDFGGGFDEVEGLGFGFDESPAEETPEVATEEISLDTTMEPELDLDEGQPSLELSDEPELEIDDGQPSLELSEEPSLELPEDLDLDTGEMNAVEEDSSIELPDEFDLGTGEMDDVEEESSLELPDDLDLSDEPELMETEEYSDEEDDGGIEFDLDSVDLDEPEDISYEVPEAGTDDDEISYEIPEADTDDDEISFEVPEADAGDDGVTYEVPEAGAGDEEPSMDFDGLELEMESPEEPEDEDLTQ